MTFKCSNCLFSFSVTPEVEEEFGLHADEEMDGITYRLEWGKDANGRPQTVVLMCPACGEITLSVA